MRAFHCILIIGLITVATVCDGSDRVEIVLDASAAMWDPLPNGMPRLVAARMAINALAISPAVRDLQLDIGLRTIGGRTDISDGFGCGDTATIVASGPVVPSDWSAALSGLDPKGGRALVTALEAAVDGLDLNGGKGRIVVITSGADECDRDIGTVLSRLTDSQRDITVRFIGLDVGYAWSSSLIESAPTRDVTDAAELNEMLQWAILPQGVGTGRPEWLELHVSRGGASVDGATVFVANALTGDEATTAIEAGNTRIRVPPGLYRARIESPEFEVTEIAGITHLGNDQALKIDVSPAPEVTLEVEEDGPLAGNVAYIHYWGAPPGSNRVGIILAGARASEYVAQTQALDSTGEVALLLPDSPNELEVLFTQDIGSDAQQVLGRLPFSSRRRRVSLEAQDRVENRTQLSVTASGDQLPGDHITIATPGSTNAESVLCSPGPRGEKVTFATPALPGDYIVRYISRRGRTLARTDLVVFEVLATLDSPSAIAPGNDLLVEWTGPDGAQDYLSISEIGQDDGEYESFASASSGNPARLTAPRQPGIYEVRYVRAADGEVLARNPLSVVTEEISLDFLQEVEAGTRFEVAWSGTAADGDFIAVAHPKSGPKKHLDWSYTNLGSPVTLAAPFDRGRYVIRYISGETQKIIARAPIEVR